MQSDNVSITGRGLAPSHGCFRRAEHIYGLAEHPSDFFFPPSQHLRRHPPSLASAPLAATIYRATEDAGFTLDFGFSHLWN